MLCVWLLYYIISIQDITCYVCVVIILYNFYTVYYMLCVWLLYYIISIQYITCYVCGYYTI